MKIIENIRLAWAGLRANKMRSLLTMLGIIIGIASVIGILTVGNSLSGAVTGQMSSLGATNITVWLQEREDEFSSMESMFSVAGGVPEESLISDDMIAALRERYPDEISGIALMESVGNGKAKLGRDYANLSITGINTDYMSVNSVDMIKGREILQKDIDGRRNVAVVSDKLVNNLFSGSADAAIGQELVVYAGNEIYTFNIIGVYKYVANAAMGYSLASDKDVSTPLYIPVSTAKKLAGADEGYIYITVAASEDIDSAAFAGQAAKFLNRYYGADSDYQVSSLSMETMLDSVDKMMNTISIAVAVIAGISLLVGGIGVMNIMLVSVTERTREIGTRKAIGATNSDIRIQFVVESMIVCLIGGIIGMLLGAVLGYVGSSLISEATLPSVGSIILAVGFSLAIGVFFGYYPANKAARLDPIEALRYE